MTRFVGTPLRGTEFSTVSDEAVSARVGTDTQPRIRIDAGGRITWSDGVSAGDTTLYRSAADTLTTDDVFKATGGIVTLATAGAPTQSLSNGAVAVDTTNHVFYFRSNSTWNPVRGSLNISDTPPSNPMPGDMWFESDTGMTFVYYDGFWVEINNQTGPQGSQGPQGYQGPQGVQGPQGFQGSTGPIGYNYTYSATAPSSPVVGDRWVDSNSGIEYTYISDGDSSQWVETKASGYLGQQGAQGSQGSQGSQGPQGTQGITGPAKLVQESISSATISNTTAETELFNVSQTAVADTCMYRITAGGTYRNSSGGTVGFTFRFKIGATTVLTSASTPQVNAGEIATWRAIFEIIMVGSRNAQRIFGRLTGNRGTSTWSDVAIFNFVGYGVATEDLTTAKNISLTAQMGTANTLTNVILQAFTIEEITE